VRTIRRSSPFLPSHVFTFFASRAGSSARIRS
jgi:hypothetical protein